MKYIFTLLTIIGFGFAQSAVTLEICGDVVTFEQPPSRALTMNQAATEIMLSLGLEQQMVGTAYMDDSILPRLEAAYSHVPVIAKEYPSQEAVFALEPDFIYGVYASAFGDEAAGPREELSQLGIQAYLSKVACEDKALRAQGTIATLFQEIRDIALIFDVVERGETLIAEMEASLAEVVAAIPESAAQRIFWYDSGLDDLYAGACCGIPNEIITLAGAENIFADAQGSWAAVSWEALIARDPDFIVVIDAAWSPAQEKIDLLKNTAAYNSIRAVQNDAFLVLPFSATTLGVRNIDAVHALAQALYPASLAMTGGVKEGVTEEVTPVAAAPLASRSSFPVTVESCGEPVTFTRAPERAVTNDVNITEIFLDLGLVDKLVGYSGVRDTRTVGAMYQPLLEAVPLLSPQYIDLETLVGAEPDFFFAGWNYGFSEDKGITPNALEPFGIQSYVLTESCIRIMEREAVSLEDTFNDLLNLSKIFGIEAVGQAKVAAYRAELADIEAKLPDTDTPLNVFVYDSGEDTPFTAARFAMPNAMIEKVGGKNIFNDVDSSWTRVSWEDVVARNPDFIIIIDYGEISAAGKIAFLESQPELSHITAIQEGNYVVMTYAEATPGPRNVAVTRRLAEAFYPEQFAHKAEH